MVKSSQYKGPLTGVKVLDFGHYYAGPMAGMLLADQGASVIRVVRPGNPELSEEQYRLINRNKKLLTLDLKSHEGKLHAQSLIKNADILIENFRPGVMQRLGLGYATLKEINPGLIYLSLPGFSSTDATRANIQAWEGILAAASCAYTELSLVRQGLGYPPIYTSVPLCSTYGAVLGGVGIMAALLAREKHHTGTLIEIPLVEAGLSALSQNMAGFGGISWPTAPDALKYSSGDPPSIQLRKLNIALQEVTGLGSKAFRCLDGRDIYVSIYLSGSFSERFFRLLGIDKQLKSEGFVNLGPWQVGLDNDVGNTGALSVERKQRFLRLITDALLTRTAFEWEEIFAKGGVPAAAIRSREEYLSLPPMLKSGVLSKLGERDDVLVVPGKLCDVESPDGEVPIWYEEARYITPEESHVIFKSEESVTDINYSYKSLKKGDLLNGLKALDLCNVIAGPTSGHILAEYGAEVIKVESPDGVYPMFIPVALDLNQGKRSILNDIRTAPGREIFNKLVALSDVVLHNCLDDTAKRLGVTQEQLELINPKVVSCQLSANGGSSRGGWELRPSFDNLIQGLNGLLAEYGSLEYPHWHGAISSADTIGGYSMAFATLLAVWQQRKTGYAGEARTSLIRATNYYQLPNMIAQDGRINMNNSRGQFAVGPHWWQRIYACKDGWIYVGASKDKVKRLVEAVTSPDLLEAAFSKQGCDYWLVTLEEAGIACHPVMTSVDVQSLASVRQVGNGTEDEEADGPIEILRWENHPCGRPVTRFAAETSYLGLDRSVRRLSPAPKYGQHTRQILSELGYSESEIEQFIRIKVSHEYLPGIGSQDRYFFDPDE